MRNNAAIKSVFPALVLWIAMSSIPAMGADPHAAQRSPLGIYALVEPKKEIADATRAGVDPDAYLLHLYGYLLDNPAIAGLALQSGWDLLNPQDPAGNPDAVAYYWNPIDDAFAAVAAWNARHPGAAPKTVQFQFSPGFRSPAWLIAKLPSCDGLFPGFDEYGAAPQPVSTNCGWATFTLTEGRTTPLVTPLPLAWDAQYKAAWRQFVHRLAQRYGDNPALVTVAVAGPTAASVEIIMPNRFSDPRWTKWFSPNGGLLAFHYPDDPTYWNSDKAFVVEWQTAIDMFSEVFRNTTLAVNNGSGLPNFPQPTGAPPLVPPPGFAGDCSDPNMDCVAETSILSYFAVPHSGGKNAKAVQSDGLTGSGLNGPFQLSVKWMSANSASGAPLPGSSTPISRLIGGLQFNTGFVRAPVEEGCKKRFTPDDWPNIPKVCLAPGVTLADVAGYTNFADVPSVLLISPEQALYNALSHYFEHTVVGDYYGVTAGTAPMNYLQIYAADILYTSGVAACSTASIAHGTCVSVPAPPVTIMNLDVATDTYTIFGVYSAQDLLNQASQQILQTTSESPTLP